jgi:hypothetical protein
VGRKSGSARHRDALLARARFRKEITHVQRTTQVHQLHEIGAHVLKAVKPDYRTHLPSGMADG